MFQGKSYIIMENVLAYSSTQVQISFFWQGYRFLENDLFFDEDSFETMY